MAMSKRERALRKVQRAIDALIDIQDMGESTRMGTVQHILDELNALVSYYMED